MRKHYHLVAGEVVFVDNGTTTLQALKSNAIHITTDGNIRHRDIAKMQQALQMMFQRKLLEMGREPESLPQIIDVFIFNISSLGKMTNDDFNRPPEGTTIVNSTNDPFAPEAPVLSPEAPAS